MHDCKSKGFLLTDPEYVLDIDSDGEEIEEELDDDLENFVKTSGFTYEEMEEIANLHNKKGWGWKTIQHHKFKRLTERQFYR